MKSPANRLPTRSDGFTLLEVLVATVMGAVILTAVNALLYGSLRLRENAEKTIQLKHPIQHALATLKNDLLNIVAPDGTITGSMIGEHGGGLNQSLDSLEFYTSTGILSEDDPWGDVQKVEYSLMQGRDSQMQTDRYLVRSITRNLLSTVIDDPENIVLLKSVYSMELSYYNGESWQNTWDSTTEDTPLPTAIQIRILYIPTRSDDGDSSPNRQLNSADRNSVDRLYIPIEAILPIIVIPKEEEEETDTDTSAEENEEDDNDDDEGGGNTNTGGNQTPSPSDSSGTPTQGGRTS